uniref:Presequence protease, mitochondrial n=3 Tax=Hirondellea gigas TaxID=1518452 RepID=A0A2P2HYL1_9CRUS
MALLELLKGTLARRLASRLLYRRQSCRTKLPSYNGARASHSSAAGSAVRSQASVGAELSGFKVMEVHDISEMQLTAVRLQHVLTGAQYLHVAKDEPNNVFCIGFRTTPLDSTGVPHILEHTVLCGSNKYPVRDPFFKMLNRSLSTFMNAMTGSDYTIYPFSTQNPADFRNLMSVYLDAVFKPNLSELDFCQEGWRLEHSDVNDRNSPLEFKGVVFNEMKGVFADSQNLFMQKLQNGLLPSHTYGVVSGGYPLDIPKLSWAQLKRFHKHHYHPSNARIFTYGDQNLLEHLEFINENYLQHYSKVEPHTEVPDEPRWSMPQADHIHCGVDSLAAADAQNSIAVSYLLTDVTDIFECFVLSVLCELLIGGPNAPFYKSLLEPKFGSSFSPATGYSGHTRNTSFTIGLQGTKYELQEDILSAIETTFDKARKEGFPQERIDAVLHTIELGLKHQTPNFGIGLAMNLAPFWNQDGNPIESLKVNESVDKLKKSLKDNPKFFQDKINQYFVKNKHKYTLTMSPKPDFEELLKESEAELLRSRINNLTEEGKDKIFELGKTLVEKQNAVEDISCLPTLETANISRKVEPIPISELLLSDGVPVQICSQPTNDVAYFHAVLDAQCVPQELMPLVPLLCDILTKMGAGELDFRQFDQEAELRTGGLSVGAHLQQDLQNYNVEKGVMFSSYCLQQNLPKMLSLWEKVINELNLYNIDRFSTLVKIIAAEESNSVVQKGHGFAMQSAAASTSMYGAIREQWSGLSFVTRMKDLADTDNLKPTLLKLSELAFILLGKKNLRVAMNVSPQHTDASIKELEVFLNSLEGTPTPYETHPTIDSSQFTPHTQRTHHVFPFPVNYTGQALAGVPYRHADAGPLRVMGRLMVPYLHREIREKGGAYGGGISVSPGGPIAFYSYRDPNSRQTFDAFRRALDWVLNGEFTERNVEEAKLGVFQSVDAPVGPGSRGMRYFLSRVTDSIFEHHRQNILDTDSQDIIRVARTHVADSLIEGACLIGPPNEEIVNDPLWTTVQH